jgi:TRAP-type C4-dicarboxylate transport system permease large subunit
MWWVKVLVLLLIAASVVALFKGLASMVRGESADGRTVRALAWRVGFSLAVFLFLILSMYMGWLQPHDIRYTERYGVPIEQPASP